MISIEQYIGILNEKEANRKYIKKELLKHNKHKKTNLKYLKDLKEARSIIQVAAQATQQFLKDRISTIVSNALKAVFEDPYTFKIEFVKRRNSMECDLLFEKKGQSMGPLDSCGYGAADVASLALRIAYWKLDGDCRNLLVLDEPTRNLSRDKQPLAGQIIKHLSESFNLQFLIVTHNKALIDSADKVFDISKLK